jgi:hypothetical protein
MPQQLARNTTIVCGIPAPKCVRVHALSNVKFSVTLYSRCQQSGASTNQRLVCVFAAQAGACCSGRRPRLQVRPPRRDWRRLTIPGNDGRQGCSFPSDQMGNHIELINGLATEFRISVYQKNRCGRVKPTRRRRTTVVCTGATVAAQTRRTTPGRGSPSTKSSSVMETAGDQ